MYGGYSRSRELQANPHSCRCKGVLAAPDGHPKLDSISGRQRPLSIVIDPVLLAVDKGPMQRSDIADADGLEMLVLRIEERLRYGSL